MARADHSERTPLLPKHSSESINEGGPQTPAASSSLPGPSSSSPAAGKTGGDNLLSSADREALSNMFPSVILGMLVFTLVTVMFTIVRFIEAGSYSCINPVGGHRALMVTIVELCFLVLMAVYVVLLLFHRTFPYLMRLSLHNDHAQFPKRVGTIFTTVFGEMPFKDAASNGVADDVPVINKDDWFVGCGFFIVLLLSSTITTIQQLAISSDAIEGILGSNMFFQLFIEFLRDFCVLCLMYKFRQMVSILPNDSREGALWPALCMAGLQLIYTVALASTEIAIKVRCALNAGHGRPEDGAQVDSVTKVLLVVNSLAEFLLCIWLLDFPFHSITEANATDATVTLELQEEGWLPSLEHVRFLLTAYYTCLISYVFVMACLEAYGSTTGRLVMHLLLLVIVMVVLLLIASFSEPKGLVGYFFSVRNMAKSFTIFVVGYGGLLGSITAGIIIRNDNGEGDLRNDILMLFINVGVYWPMFLLFPSQAVAENIWIRTLHCLFMLFVVTTNLYAIAGSSNSASDNLPSFFARAFECVVSVKLLFMIVRPAHWDNSNTDAKCLRCDRNCTLCAHELPGPARRRRRHSIS